MRKDYKMAWFDGTYNWTHEKLEKEYPKVLAKDLRQSANGLRLALINHFEDGDPLLDLTDPKTDEDEYGKHVFYHTFIGHDATAAKDAFTAYFEMGNHLWPDNLVLLRQEGDRLFEYGFGHVCRPLLERQEELQRLLPEGFVREQDVFMLPLKRYMYSCPVCWERTLPYRGDCIICPECGWEDDGTDMIDVPTITNGDYTIRSYRKIYLQGRVR